MRSPRPAKRSRRLLLAAPLALLLAGPATAECPDSHRHQGQQRHGAHQRSGEEGAGRSEGSYRLELEQASPWDRDDGRGAILYRHKGRLRVSFETLVGGDRVEQAVLHLNGSRAFRIDDRRRHRRGHFAAFEDKAVFSEGCLDDAFVRLHFRGGEQLDLWIPPHRIRAARRHCGVDDHRVEPRRGAGHASAYPVPPRHLLPLPLDHPLGRRR